MWEEIKDNIGVITWAMYLLIGTVMVIYLVVSKTYDQGCLGVAFAFSFWSGLVFGYIGHERGKKKGYKEGYYKAEQKYINPNDYYNLRQPLFHYLTKTGANNGRKLIGWG